MKSSGLEIFDFNEEDELPDVAAGKFLEKFKTPNSEDNAILKYKFLECVAQETSVHRDVVTNTHYVDLDSVNCDQKLDKTISSTLTDTTGDDFAKNVDNPRLDDAKQSNFTSHEQQVDLDISSTLTDTTEDDFAKNVDNPRLDAAKQSNSTSHEQVEEDNQESQSPFTEPETQILSLRSPSPKKDLLHAHLDSDLRVEPVDMFADADECASESATSSPSDIAEDGVSLNGWASDHCFGDLEMDQRNTAVMLRPDYVVYQDIYCTESLVTFSQNYIKTVGHWNNETFNFECEIDDIVGIKCQWFQGVDTLLVKLHVISKDAVETDNAHGTTGMELLKFAVVEPNWAEKQTQITCLNDKYSALLDVVVDEEMDGDDLSGRSYFPRFDEPFEEVVYPKGDVDAVSISKRDVDLLQPETFINDTIIDFYIKYLKNQIQSEERTRFHFFNSFFFRKLADLDKDPSSASDGRAAFLRVRKWTRKVDLFKKDYIFIPVNFNLHWSLIVICHPGEVATFVDGDEDLDHLHKVPCILHMDSIKGSHSGLKNLVQSYLWEEWKERQMEISEQISSKFSTLRFVELELPQQENSFDCGLFLLHYLELFLADAPVRFNLFQINKFSAFLNAEWFPPVEASLKRGLIQKLIFELLENRSREISSAACNDDHISSKVPENNGKEICMEFISERCNPGLSTHHQNLSASQNGDGIEITLLAASSVKSSQCVDNSGPVLRDLFESRAEEGSSAGQYQSYQGSTFFHLEGDIMPLEEDGETGEDFVLLPSEETGFGLTSRDCSISQTSRGFKADTAWDPAISGHVTDEDGNLLANPSDYESDDDIGIIEHFPTGISMGLSQEEENDGQNSLPMENFEDETENLVPSLEIEETSAIDGSQDLDEIDANDREHIPSEDNASIYMTETTVEGALESSAHLDNNHATMENTHTAEGSQLEKTIPSEDPAFSKVTEISTIEGSQDSNQIEENGDHTPEGNPQTPFPPNSDSVGIELEHEHTKSEHKDVSGDDAENLHKQSAKRSDVPESEEQQAAKKMRLSPPEELPENPSDELHL